MFKTPILIVGAGPTGLMLSAQLHRHGAAHTIIDRKDGVTPLSKALAVQARTLEQYRQLGIVDAALDEGFIGRNMRFIVNGRVKAKVVLGELGAGLSPYPYIFILEQSRNEKLLADFIASHAGSIDWSTELEDVETTTEGYRATLKRNDGTIEPVECQYLIGCEGASSAVRHFIGTPFRGMTNEQMFFVADITMKTELKKQGVLLAINGKEFLGFFPMPGPDQYRAIGILPKTVTDPDDFAFELLKTHIEANVGIPAEITGHTWHSGYRVHHRIADGFRKANAFLVGDAAHVHSPAGGQGMNTGLGDAVNLGWKLAAVTNGWSAPDILDSYEAERRPFGVQLVNTTDRAFSTMVSQSGIARFVRTHVVPRALRTILKFGPLRKQMFKTVSQTRIHYRNVGLSDGSGRGSLRSGDRFPWFAWDGGNSFDWLSEPGYVVLRFSGAPAEPVSGWSGPVLEFDVTGAAAEAAAAVGLPTNGSAVVRPDMHLGTIVHR